MTSLYLSDTVNNDDNDDDDEKDDDNVGDDDDDRAENNGRSTANDRPDRRLDRSNSHLASHFDQLFSDKNILFSI